MKREYFIAVVSVLGAVLLLFAAIPVQNSDMTLRGGGAVVMTPARSANISRCLNTGAGNADDALPVRAAYTDIPAYMQHLLRPMTGAQNAPAVISVSGTSLRSASLPSFSIIPLLGIRISFGVFFRQTSFQDMAPAAQVGIEKSTAGVEIHFGNVNPACIHASCWIGVPVDIRNGSTGTGGQPDGTDPNAVGDGSIAARGRTNISTD